jgi:hypothetical protein
MFTGLIQRMGDVSERRDTATGEAHGELRLVGAKRELVVERLLGARTELDAHALCLAGGDRYDGAEHGEGRE